MLPLQVPGGPELIVILLIFGLFAIVPIALIGVGIYLYSKRSNRVEELEARIEELEADRPDGE